MKKAIAVFAATLLSALPAFACSVSVSDAYIRVPPKSAAAGAAFLTINNPCQQDDKLVAAEADISKIVELHTHVHDGNIMRMRAVDSIAVPAGGNAKLQPGGDHIMFITLTKTLSAGDQVPVTLVFEKAGRHSVTIPVVGINNAHH